jgi:flagellar hook assembly protein FlgD
VLNNSQSSNLEYFVAEDEDLVLRNVYNYPNPMSSETQFVFEHNQPVGTSARIQIRIYTLSGQIVRSIESDEVLPGGMMQVPWDGRDEDADRLATGIYLYKVRVEVDSPEGDRQVSEHIEKLAVLR